MQARDIMTKNVITVGPQAGVDEVARLLMEHRISGVPVVADNGAILGIISEVDLVRRADSELERSGPWWLKIFASDESAGEYVKRHGTLAEHVMTRDVITVDEETSAGEIAHRLEAKRIKRVPVVRDGKIVGIISRANLLHGLAAGKQGTAATASADDRTLRAQITKAIEGQDWVTHGGLNVIVSDGVVELWGWVESDSERKAMKLAVEGFAGVRSVEDHLGTVAPWTWGI